jgi:HAD superfamily hydrolase (TIGR01549 family)
MLNELQAFRLGLVTSSDRDEVEPLLRAAGIHTSFGAIVYADDTKRHKPDSEPYLLVRERLAIQTGIVFEDSDSGLESALTAGFIAIRVDRPENLPAIVKGSLS